ncbi:hypothetical protein BH24ACI4_BH24ACI4_13560 [soil metagenome]
MEGAYTQKGSIASASGPNPRPLTSVHVLFLTLLLLATLLLSGDAQTRRQSETIWFAPAPGSLDMRRLFEAPDEWPRARRVIDVFKFYQQHTMRNPPELVGPNSYDALVRTGAFRTLRDWGKRIALEAGSVKEFYCTADESGMRESIRGTVESLNAVQEAGATVSYLTMDEPFLSGLSPRCGGPALEPTADRLQVYMSAVRRAHPATQIGLIEAYPTFGPDDFARMLHLMRDRGVLPAFLHVDVDLNALRRDRDNFAPDMLRIFSAAVLHRIPFGIIIWGNNGDADALYAADARRLADAFHAALEGIERTPDHLIIQSWAESRTGLRITPQNLPEGVPNTHTALLNEFHRKFQIFAVPRAR